MEKSQPVRRRIVVHPRIPFHQYFSAFVPATTGMVFTLLFVEVLPFIFGYFSSYELYILIMLFIPSLLGGITAHSIMKNHRRALRMSWIMTGYLIMSVILGFIPGNNTIFAFFNEAFIPFYAIAIPLQIVSLVIVKKKKIGQPDIDGTSPQVSPAGSRPAFAHQPGEVLHSHYRIVEGIGQGASGSAYIVKDLRHSESEVQWVLKEMDTRGLTLEERQEALELFQRECQLLKALNHPAIPKVIDFFHHEEASCLVMEHVTGRSLEAMVRERGKPMDADTVFTVTEELSQILSYLHSQSPHPLIFRDMKPSNIIMTDRGRLRLIDFGIARFFSPGKVKDTFVYGTPGFSPPEQYGTGQTDERSDIYAMGATVYYLLTGEDPQRFYFSFPPVRQFNTSVSRDFEKVLSKCLMKNPVERYAHTGKLRGDLEKIRIDEEYEHQSSLPNLWIGIYFIVALVVQFLIPYLFMEINRVHYGIVTLMVALLIPAVIVISSRAARHFLPPDYFLRAYSDSKAYFLWLYLTLLTRFRSETVKGRMKS